ALGVSHDELAEVLRAAVAGDGPNDVRGHVSAEEGRGRKLLVVDPDGGLAVLELHLGFRLGGGYAGRGSQIAVDSAPFGKLDRGHLHVGAGKGRRRETDGGEKRQGDAKDAGRHGYLLLLFQKRIHGNSGAGIRPARIYLRPNRSVNSPPEVSG